MVGAVTIRPDRVLLELLDHVPGVDVDSGLSPSRQAIVWDIRFPRVVLGLMVGGMLAASGAAYQATSSPRARSVRLPRRCGSFRTSTSAGSIVSEAGMGHSSGGDSDPGV